MRRRKVEVLAPAGSFESMKAAVAAGADAVYIGGSRFGARAYADNLDQERMLEAIDYAHLHGVSLYMTVNTLVKEEELDQLYDYLKPYYERGLDAVIVQDLGVFAYIRRYFPDLPIHASTQMTITGYHGARILADMGASRVVTARELSLEEIRRIHEEVDLEIECFVHGALCYCYSGQCLLSSLIGGRSGNRGRCAQPCRLPYEVTGRKEAVRGRGTQQKKGTAKNRGLQQQSSGGRHERKETADDRYILSMKDLCTLDILPDMIEAGVYSLKIEGRMKSPRYTAGVVRIYRKYVDTYLAHGRKGYRVEEKDRQELLDLFDRGGFTEGYYRQQNGPDMIASREKPVFRQVNQELFDLLDREYVEKERKEMVCGVLRVTEGQPVELELSMADSERFSFSSVSVGGIVAQTAQNQPAAEEKLAKQIRKTGNTPFEFQSLQIHLEGNVFLPVQALNELRRNGLEALTRKICGAYERTCPADLSPETEASGVGGDLAENRERKAELHVLLSGEQGLEEALASESISEVMIESDGIDGKRWSEVSRRCHEAGKRCVIAMPIIFRERAEAYFDRNMARLREACFDGILVRALEEIDYLKKNGIEIPLLSDHNLYSFNHLAAETLKKQGISRMTLPLELNSKELERLGCGGRELVIYGYLPAMVSAQCVKKTVSGCTGQPAWTDMKDRTGKLLSVRNHCTFCYNTIYNPSPLSLLDQKELIERLAPAALRLQFTRESSDEIGNIIGVYTEAFCYGRKGDWLLKDFTRGHFKRGVE